MDKISRQRSNTCKSNFETIRTQTA